MKKVLGKGLNALLPSPATDDGRQAVFSIDIDKIRPNPDQPRKDFDVESLRLLSESISSVGIVQPIIVKDEGAYYRIIAGERRWRAAGLIGLETVPAIIRSYSDNETVEIALIENLQRQDLNPIEEAEGYERLLSEYGYTQDRIAKSVGRSRSAVANAVRLLKLSSRIRGLISQRLLSSGHARALLAVSSEADRETLTDEILNRDLNVRQIEAIVNGAYADGKDDREAADRVGEQPDEQPDIPQEDNAAALNPIIFARLAALDKIEDALRNSFNTRVALTAKKSDGKGGGRIVIDYYSDEELQRLLERWGIRI